MSAPLVIALVVAAAGLVAGLVYWSHVLEKRRTEGFATFARRRRLTFLAEAVEPERRGLPPLPVLSRGRARRVRNVARGTVDETELAIFDSSYQTGSHKHRHVHRHTVALFRFAGRNLPAFELAPENVLVRIATAFGYQDLDFDSFPEFSKTYLLRGRDEPAVRALFRPTLLRAFEKDPGWSVEADGEWVAVYRTAGRRSATVPLEELDSFLVRSRAVAGRLVAG